MADRSVVNVNWHGIGPTVRPLDPGEERTWVTIDQFERMLDAVAGRPDVVITFDDGNASDVDIALPRLVERGLTARFFVIAGQVGRPGRVTRAGVRELVDAGMTIGSHGWAHRDWRRLEVGDLHDEMERAPQVLEAISGRDVVSVAIPFGSYDRRVLSRLRRAGTARAYTSDGGRTMSGRWLQSRTSVRRNTTVSDLEDLLDRRPHPMTDGRRAAILWAKRNRL